MGAEEASPAPATPGGGKSASRDARGTPITPDESKSSEDVDAPAPGSPAESERPALPVVALDEGGSSDATPSSPVAPNEPSSPVAPNELEAWLVENVEAERRAAVRGAADGLDDLQGCDLNDLEEALELKTWPDAQREKFLDAWRALNKDDAPAPAASAATTRDALAAAAAAAAPPSTKKLEPLVEPDTVYVPKPVAPKRRTGGHYRSKACEVRRIGDPEWRTFSSRADAARAFPGLTSFDVFNLIEKPRTCKKAVREIYEARNVGGAPPAPAPPPPPPRSRYGTRSATPPAASAGPRYGTRAATAPLPREVPSAMEWPRELSEVLRSRAVACTFVSPNPKRARGNTSKSVDAYETYMDATTVDDFFERGGTWAHLKYDVQRGYCTLDAAALKEAWKECGAAPLRRLRSRSLGRVSTRLTTESDRETRFEPADPQQIPELGTALEDADTLYEKVDIESLVALEAAAVEKSAAVLRRREAMLIATRKAGRSNACEVRRVGEEWRRFERQADACRAFPDLSQGDLSRLINNAPDCSPALRLRFEARRVGAASPVPEEAESVTGDVFDDAAAIRAAMEHCVARVAKQDDEPSAAALAWAARQPADSTAAQAISGLGVEMVAAAVYGRRSLKAPEEPAAGKRLRARLPTAERLRRSGKLVRFVLAPDAPAMTTVAAADGLFVTRKRPAPVVEPLKLPESVLPVRFFETPARSDVTVTMDRMVDEVARDTKRPRLISEPVDPAIRATVEFLVAETARPDDVASVAAEAWAARQNDEAAAQSISKLGVEMVSTVVHGSARQCGTHWRPAHMYAFLAATRFVDEARARALRDVLLAGRCGDISSSRTRRVVTRLFGNDLRMLERFQHASRKAPPQVRDATVAWYDPESGLDLFPYASCGTAALEWGLTPEIVRDCVEGRQPTANGLYFRRQTSWLLPAGAEMVACGVYRVGDRYRVQLGHDWGFLGNFDSAATATLVHRDARAKLRRAGLALTAQTASQLSRGKAVSLGGCYVLLRRLSSGSDFDVPSMGPTVRDFALRAKGERFVAFEGSYDAYFVSQEHGRGADGDISIALEEASEPMADSNSLLWWDPVDPSHGVCSRELRTFDIGDGDEYRGIYYRLVRKAYDGSVVFDDEDTSLVQLWCEPAKDADLKKEEDVRVKAWRASLAAGLDGTVRVLSAPKAPSTCLWQRVWARFDADAASPSDQHWWGGTVVGYSTKSTRSGQATHLDIVWDDGDRMHMLERDVRKTPPSVQLDITAPTAKANTLIRKILGAAPKRSRSERDVRDEARAARRAARSPMKPRAAMKPRIYGWRAPRLFTADL